MLFIAFMMQKSCFDLIDSFCLLREIPVDKNL